MATIRAASWSGWAAGTRDGDDNSSVMVRVGDDKGSVMIRVDGRNLRWRR